MIKKLYRIYMVCNRHGLLIEMFAPGIYEEWIDIGIPQNSNKVGEKGG